MYSPKIPEDLVRILYRTAKAKKLPMTKVVEQLIRNALAHEWVNDTPMSDLLCESLEKADSRAVIKHKALRVYRSLKN